MQTCLERISSGEVLLSDGAMGTLLIEKGLRPGDCPESLNLSRPDILREIAAAYLEAGADLIQTNTFGASPVKLAASGLAEKCGEINERGVDLVRKAVEGRAYVSASCGPSGKLLKPYGDGDPELLAEGYERQIGAMARAGADLICIETMVDVKEACIALAAAKKVASLPVMVTMTYQQTPRGFYTIMGNSLADATRVLEGEGADILGSNCGNGIAVMVAIAGELRKATRLPLVIQANAGLPEMVPGGVRYPESPELFGQKTRELVAAGVSIIGGCCGTTPAHVAAMRRALRGTRDPSPIPFAP